MLTRDNLHQYQLDAIDYIKGRPKCGLFLDMGLGKTGTTLTAISDLFFDIEISKVLIIAPLRVANTVWRQESQKWEHLNHLEIGIATGSAKNRTSVINANYPITIINRECLVWLCDNHPFDYDMVVIDESSKFKSHASKAFKALKKQLNYIDRMVLLTGTPSPQGIMDIWSQIYLIDKGERLGKTISSFRSRFFDMSPWSRHVYLPRPQSHEIVQTLISDICMSMTAQDKLSLPDVVYTTHLIELSTNLLVRYRKFAKDFILEVGAVDDISASTAAVLTNKLLQFCNGNIYDNDGNATHIHDLKLQALREILDDNPNDNILLAYNFKTDIEDIKKEFPEAVELNDDNLTDWDEGKIRLLCAHPASAGHGLNIQKGGSIVVWYGLTWSLELYQQFNARLARQGQNNTVRIVHLAIKDCMDEQVIQALDDKNKIQSYLIDHLKF